MEYRGFEVFATAIPDEFLSEERKSGGIGKVFTCEIYAARDEGLANVLDVFELVEGKDIPVDCEDLITPLQMRVDKNYEMLMEKSALSMDRFIKINGAVFSFEEVAKALGVECDPKREPVQLHLCQRVDDGVLVAKGAFFDKDDYPAIDLELQLPSEKDSLPVMISRTEQPRVEGAYSDGYLGVRNFVYNREGEYFMYSDVDSRADEVVDRAGMEQRVMVSGSRLCDVEVYQENPWVRMMGQKEFEYPQEGPDVKFEVGMTGVIRDVSGIKKELRGKTFQVVEWHKEEPGEAYCTIEGKAGIYLVYRDQVENLRMPEQAVARLDDLVAAAEKGNVGKGTVKEINGQELGR